MKKNLHQQPQKKNSFFVAVGASFFHRPLMQVNETGHAQRLNMLKERPRKWFFDRKIDLLLSENISTLCLAEGYTINEIQ